MLRKEYRRLLHAYLNGEATVAETRRLNEIVEQNRELARDFRNEVQMHLLFSRSVEKERTALVERAREEGFVDLPAEPEEPRVRAIPLIGPKRPRSVVCIMAANLEMQPHHWN